MEGITQDDRLPTEQTQRAEKHPIEEPAGKGMKVAKKIDRASDMTIALQEYTALAREQFKKKKGKSMGSSDHVAQSATGGDPCSLGRALEGRMVSPNDPFWTFDFDDAYFDSDDDDMESSGCGDDMDVSDCDHDMNVSDCDVDMDTGADTDSNYDSEEDEFWIVFPLIGSYYLVDSGYAIGASFFPPHKSTRSYAQEFSAEKRHVREMSDAAKRPMGEFRDDVTARMWKYAR
nr:hypothetical protein CFP56_58454 [Quercus suber]